MEHQAPDVSVVMPCLNEEATIGGCVARAREILANLNLHGEVIVADNGSQDRSAEIATRMGARVVHQPLKGYGYAYHRGLAEAKGRYIVMADSDGTYDLSEMGGLLAPLRNGYDFVTGSRLKGRILPEAMPLLHRFVGVPLLTWLLNRVSGARVSDAHCGMRAFRREALESLSLHAGGMEFASEMIIAFARAGFRIAEIPITYYPRGGRSKLHAFRDGWRHLRFILIYGPFLLFLLPGLFLMIAGLGLVAALLPGPITVAGVYLSIHTMLLGSLMAVVGMQVVILGIYSKVFSLLYGFLPRDRSAAFLLRHASLERGLLLGSLLALGGLGWLAWVLFSWAAGDFSRFEGGELLRVALLGMTLLALGVQVMFSSFFLSLMTMARR